MVIEYQKFVITKGLAKAPEDYPDGKSLPHVLVAKRMREQVSFSFFFLSSALFFCRLPLSLSLCVCVLFRLSLSLSDDE